MPSVAAADVINALNRAKDHDRPAVVKFEKKDGTIRTMIVASPTFSSEFVKGALPPGKRKAEDAGNNTLTVFALDVFAEGVAEGLPRARAGRDAWRRISLGRVRRVEVL